MAKASDSDTRTQSLVEGAAEGQESVLSCVMVIDCVRPASKKRFQITYTNIFVLKYWQLLFLFFFFLFFFFFGKGGKICREDGDRLIKSPLLISRKLQPACFAQACSI